MHPPAASTACNSLTRPCSRRQVCQLPISTGPCAAGSAAHQVALPRLWCALAGGAGGGACAGGSWLGGESQAHALCFRRSTHHQSSQRPSSRGSPSADNSLLLTVCQQPKQRLHPTPRLLIAAREAADRYAGGFPGPPPGGAPPPRLRPPCDLSGKPRPPGKRAAGGRSMASP